MVVMTFVGLLYMGRSMTFWQDDWSYVDFDGHGSLLAYLIPHNEHWSTIPRILYAALLSVLGLRSYLPYLAVLLILNLSAVVGVYVLVARRHRRLVALAMVIPLLIFGSGYENLLYASQFGFAGSVAAGVWALVALEAPGRRGAPASAILLVVSLASSGMGLFFVGAAGVRLLADPPLRQRIKWLALPAASYVLWYFTYGRSTLGETGQFASLGDTLRFGERGDLYAITRFVGLDTQSGSLGPSLATTVVPAALLLAVIVAIVWLAVRYRTMPPLALASLAAFILMYAVIGVVRADLASDFTNRSRYVYVAGFFMILLAADLLAAISVNVRASRIAICVAVPLLVLSTTGNYADYQVGLRQFQFNADLTRSYLTIIEKSHDRSWIDPAGLPLEWPNVDEVLALVAKYGSPTADVLHPTVVTRPSDAAYEQALLSLVGHGFRVDTGPSSSPEELALRVVAIDGAEPASVGVCLAVVPNGSSPSVTVQAPSGTWIRVLGSGGTGSALLGHQLRPSARTRIPFVLNEGQPTYVRIPDIGDGSTWQVTVELPRTGVPVSLCSIGQAPAADSAAR